MFTGINVTEFGRRFQNQENCYRFLYSVIGVSLVDPHMILRERPAFTGGVKVARLMIVWLLTLFFMDFECKSWRHFTYNFGLWQKNGYVLSRIVNWSRRWAEDGLEI